MLRQPGQPVVIGDKMIFPDDGALLQFAQSPRVGTSARKSIEPLHISGYFPLHWSAPFVPEIPADKEMFLTVRLPRQKSPKQGLAFLRAYLPKDITAILPNIDHEDGELYGSLVVGGKLRPEFKPEIQSGSLHLDAPLLTLNSPTSDLPSQLRKVSLAWASIWTNGPIAPTSLR